MATSSEIKARAKALAEKTDVNSITPKEVGGIMYDLASHGENVLRNGGTLGIRKVYESVSAMEADGINPVDLWGNPIKKGNLVVIYDGTTTGVDNNKVYTFMNPGWELSTELDAGYATRREITDLKDETDTKLSELGSKVMFDVNEYKGDYTPFTSRGAARAAAPYSEIGKKGLILKYLTTGGWVFEMQITDDYTSQDTGWATIYNGNDDRMKNMATDMFGIVSVPLFQVIGNTLKIYNNFNVFSSTRVSTYKTIPSQDVALPNTKYWSACLVFDLNTRLYEDTIKSFSLVSSSTFVNPTKEEGKLYIPILWCLNDESLIESRQDIRSFFPQAKPIYNTPTALAVSPYRGIYMPAGIVNGVLVNIVDTTSALSFYKFNLKTKQTELIKTFSTDTLVKGLQMLDFDTSVVIGGENQIVFSGKVGFKFVDAMDITTYMYYPETQNIQFAHNSTLLFGIVYRYTTMYNSVSEIPKIMDLILQGETINDIPTPTEISNCTSELSNVGYVGQLVTGGIRVASIDVNVRNASKDIKVIAYNMKTGKTEELKSVTPTSVGILNIPFDTPISMGETQILVNGALGYKYMSQGYGNFVGAYIAYNYSSSGIFTISKVSTIAWGIRYNISEPISVKDYVTNFVLDYYLSLDATAIKTEIINIADYDHNLRKAFQSISPSVSNRFVIEIPEGVYDVKSWFTDDEIAIEESRFMGGLRIPNYVKLVGIGAREKIILKWDNSGNNHFGNISTLNMKDWNELENMTIIGNNVRYAVHDDYQASKASRHLRVVNCDFQITDGSRAWGAGHNGGYNGEFINCKFSLFRGTGYVDNYTYIEPFVLHDNTYSVGDSKVLFENCRFYNEYADKPCLSFGMSANENEDITRVVVNGCSMNTFLILHGNDNVCTGRVTGYANVMGSAPQVEGVEQGEDVMDVLWSLVN